MRRFEVCATTVRDGVTVEDVEFDVDGHPPAFGYLVRGSTGHADRYAIALHGEHGDRASLLPDVLHLAANGITALAIDSPTTRAAFRDRDPLTAFSAELAIAEAAIATLNHDPQTTRDRFAVLGRGLGAEVAGRIAATAIGCRVIVAAGALPHRSAFMRSSEHALAAGLRVRLSDDELARQTTGLDPFDLVDQMYDGDATWMLQVADDDDRVDGDDRRELAIAIPGAVRITHVDEWADLGRNSARRERVDFITRLC